VFGSTAKSLRLQVCHIFCNPRSQPLCFISATEDVCLHASKPLNHSSHKSIFSVTLSLPKCTCLFPPLKAKKMRQTFVLSAEVVPAFPHPSSSLYTSPFAQLADGSRPQAKFRFVFKYFGSYIIHHSHFIILRIAFPSHLLKAPLPFFLHNIFPLILNVRNPHICFFEHCKQCLCRYASIVFFFER
jgi:hypothetical protein